MATLFNALSDGFYTAFFEPDLQKRKDRIEIWIKESTPIIQSAVENELRAYLEGILQGTWDSKGWKHRVEKYSGIHKKKEFIDTYRLYLNVDISTGSPHVIFDELKPEIREKTHEAIDIAKKAIAKLEPPSPVALKEIDLHGNTVEEAIPIIEKFLEESYRVNVRRIRIIHGKGIFVLQKAIREYLRTHKLVKSESISPAEKDHGGEGATEADLIDFSADKLN